jgi:xanthine dehydrogenase accessory factor
MQEVFREAIKELDSHKQVVLATVVRTKGSTPQKPGAKLLVRNDGSGVGTLGGGCVEGDIWFAAKELMKRNGTTQFRSYELNEDIAAQDGLVCGGTMYFLIDPVYTPEGYLSYVREIENAYTGGQSVAVATLIKPSEDSDTTLGSKLLIRQNGTTDGSLGSSNLDDEAISRAKTVMLHGRNEFVQSKNGTEYFIEGYTTPPQLILCGAGHVSKAISNQAKPLGFRIFVSDDRDEFANSKRFPEADIVLTGKPEEVLEKFPVNANSFIIIATRGHRFDNIALYAAVHTPALYVGLLGSKRKTILIYEDLLKSGISPERIKEIRSPIGLDINGRTPEEIAISILAEVLMFRFGGTGLPMKLEEDHINRILSKIQEPEPAVN